MLAGLPHGPRMRPGSWSAQQSCLHPSLPVALRQGQTGHAQECGACKLHQYRIAAHAVGLLWFIRTGRSASQGQQMTRDAHLLQSSESQSDGESEMSAHDTLLPEAETGAEPTAQTDAEPAAKRLKAAAQSGPFSPDKEAPTPQQTLQQQRQAAEALKMELQAAGDS